MSDVVYLVDASPYIFRAFHSLPSTIRDPGGRPVNAVLGFAGFLLRLIDNERPGYMAVCFDGSLTRSFRNELYPEYKAHREPPPTELEEQVPECREMAEVLGTRTLIDERYEADDLIGTLTVRALEQGRDVVVVTSDKDLAQLVNDRVTLFDFARDARLGPTEVEAKLGVPPGQVTDYLGLAGDPVDNIPGVTGIGPKTATALLAEWSTLEEILDHLDEIADVPIRGAMALRDRLEAQEDTARLSKRLATVASDVPLQIDVDDMRLAVVEESRLEAISSRLGFSTLPGRVRKQLTVAGRS